MSDNKNVDLKFLETFSTRYGVLHQALQGAMFTVVDDKTLKERAIHKLKVVYGRYFPTRKPVGNEVTKEALRNYSFARVEFLQVFVDREIPFIVYFCENGRIFEKLRDKMEESILGSVKSVAPQVPTGDNADVEVESQPTIVGPSLTASTPLSLGPFEEQKEGRKLMMSVLIFCFANRMDISEFSSLDYHLINRIQKIEPNLTGNQITEFILYARETFPKHFKDDIPF